MVLTVREEESVTFHLAGNQNKHCPATIQENGSVKDFAFLNRKNGYSIDYNVGPTASDKSNDRLMTSTGCHA